MYSVTCVTKKWPSSHGQNGLQAADEQTFSPTKVSTIGVLTNKDVSDVMRWFNESKSCRYSSKFEDF